MNTFETIQDLVESGYLFRIIDNGGETADRYTIIFSDGSYLALGDSVSLSDDGVGVVTHAQTAVDEGEAVDLSFYDLPERHQRHILARQNEGFRDYLELVEKRGPNVVAADRLSAKENDGTHTCTGDGLYSAGPAYFIRLDDDVTCDRGPYMTAAEALRASLPDAWGLAGEEYHSTCGVNAEASLDRKILVQLLEKRREESDEA